MRTDGLGAFDASSIESTGGEFLHFTDDACRTERSHCGCVVPKGHETPHVCGCGASWRVAIDGSLHVYALPAMHAEWKQLERDAAIRLAAELARRRPILVEQVDAPADSREEVPF
jgi:hypothetical protein